jgi:uncharacterized protein
MWNDLVGIQDRSFSYYSDQRFEVKVASPNHPITQGLNTWTMTDETYRMASTGECSEIILTTDYANSLTSLAWTRQYKQSRVFCTTLGHDRGAWEEPRFRILLAQGIQWCAV